MRKSYSCLALMLLLVLGPALLVSCKSDDPRTTTVDPATIELLLVQKVEKIPSLAAALQRVLLHFGDIPQVGVNLVETETGVTGTVGVDSNGDGFQDSTITGTFTWNDPDLGIAAGGVIEITELTGNVVLFTASVALTGPTQITFGNIVADVPQDGNRPRVTVSAGEIIVDVATSPPSLTGFADFVVGDLPATLLLTNDGAGNQTIVVEGDGFTITVP